MTAMQWAALVLFGVIALAVVGILWALDLAEDRRAAGCYRSTWKQRRQWRKERREAGLRLPRAEVRQ